MLYLQQIIKKEEEYFKVGVYGIKPDLLYLEIDLVTTDFYLNIYFNFTFSVFIYNSSSLNIVMNCPINYVSLTRVSHYTILFLFLDWHFVLFLCKLIGLYPGLHISGHRVIAAN